MTSGKNHIDEGSSDAAIAARLDAQDVELSVPVREFLHQNGCDVFVNDPTANQPEYWVIYGDGEYVKGIIDRDTTSAKKRYVVLSGETGDTAREFSRTYSGKIALVGIRPLSSRLVRELFAFFFTGHKKLEIFEETLVRSFEDEDKKRIADSIETIFGKALKKPTPQPAKKQRNQFPKWKSILLAIAILFLPLLWYAASLALSLFFAASSAGRLSTGDAVGAGRAAANARSWNSRAQTLLAVLRAPYQLIGLGDAFRNQERIVSFIRHATDAETSAAALVASGKDIAAGLLSGVGMAAESSPAIAADRVKQGLLSLGGSLGLAQSELVTLLSERPFPLTNTWVKRKAEQAGERLARARGLVVELGGFVSLYPTIAGFDGKKTYLVLFQNSMELRPTGGFIGSLGLLHFSDGNMTDFTIQDVYALDGQLKGHVDPPTPIRELLAQEHWYLRDSNWDPDFSVSAARAAWFYEKETGDSVDGVIAISVPLVTDVLSAIGPVDLPDYNDRISADNFFGKSLFFSQSNFFPGSTQKKDFLGTLAHAMLSKITSSKTLDPRLLSAIVGGLRSGNLLVWFADPNTQAVVERLRWAGKIPGREQCKGLPSTACLADMLMLVEANLSVNKVNYFLKRTIRQEVVFGEDGSVNESLEVTIKNNSPSGDATGGGTYLTWTRFILPEDSVLTSVTLDGSPVSEKRTKSKDIQLPPYVVTEMTESGKTIAVPYAVEPGRERKLTISYRRQQLLLFSNNAATYDLLIQKQPGMINTDVAVDVTFPIFWQPAGMGDGKQSFLANQSRLEYNTSLTENKQFTVKFSK